MNVYDQLKSLGIALPAVATPAAAYVPFVKTGNLVFLSGHIAKKDGKAWTGQFGRNMTTEEGKAAARAVAVDLLGTLHAACAAEGKDLNPVLQDIGLAIHPPLLYLGYVGFSVCFSFAIAALMIATAVGQLAAVVQQVPQAPPAR